MGFGRGGGRGRRGSGGRRAGGGGKGPGRGRGAGFGASGPPPGPMREPMFDAPGPPLGDSVSQGGAGQALAGDGPLEAVGKTSAAKEELALLKQLAGVMEAQLQELDRRIKQLESGGVVGSIARVNAALCAGCGACEQACPVGAIRVGSQGVAEVNPTTCRACGSCVQACPRGAIEIAQPAG